MPPHAAAYASPFRNGGALGGEVSPGFDEDEAPDEIGSLARSAEALRLTAAAPARGAGVARDYDR